MCLQRLVDLGNTVVVIEHNLDVIKCADWIIDMGPGAGVDGRRIGVCRAHQKTWRLARREAKRESKGATATYRRPPRSSRKRSWPCTIRACKKQPTPTVESRLKDPATAKRNQQLADANIGPAVPKNRPRQPAGNRMIRGKSWGDVAFAGKGFPGWAKPDWPLELADRMLKLLEQVAGDDSLAFESPDRVNVKPVERANLGRGGNQDDQSR